MKNVKRFYVQSGSWQWQSACFIRLQYSGEKRGKSEGDLTITPVPDNYELPEELQLITRKCQPL